MKVLYLCSQNKRRSLTAEKILNGRYGHEVRSAGTENNSRVKVTEECLDGQILLLRWRKSIRLKYGLNTKKLSRPNQSFACISPMIIHSWTTF